MYCIYPGNSVTINTLDYYNAAFRSMELRGIFLPSTGWSLAWKANIWSRFHQSFNSFQLLTMILTPNHTAPNLFHLIDGPPFQIDANFGTTSAICEMLLQSQNNQIELLPALPIDYWPNGFVKGLRARGNYQINIFWSNGKLNNAQIIPLSNSNSCQIIYQNNKFILENLLYGYIYHINSQLKLINQTFYSI